MVKKGKVIEDDVPVANYADIAVANYADDNTPYCTGLKISNNLIKLF